jgi:N6-adenosine-specific RNA methylase IME4
VSVIALPYDDGTFRAAVLDPPWDGREKGCRGYAGVAGYDVDARSHYDVLSLAEIDGFGREVLRCCASSCHLWLWTTDLFLESACELISGWGLQRKRTHVWVKTTAGISRGHRGLEGFSRERLTEAAEVFRAAGYPGRPCARTGHWGKLGHEYLLLATADSSFRTLNGTAEPSVFHAPVPGGRHSAKPPEAFELIARNSPGPRLSCFERTHRPGFVGWGDQMPAAG